MNIHTEAVSILRDPRKVVPVQSYTTKLKDSVHVIPVQKQTDVVDHITP